MAILLKTKSLNWQDVNLLAQKSAVESRSEIPVEGHRIVVSAMTSIIGYNFIIAVSQLPKEYQPTLHIPRDIFKVENLKACFAAELKHIFVGVGLNEDKEYEALALSLRYKTAFIDIANGYLPQIKERVIQLKQKGFTKIICGSVHTIEGFDYLSSLGVEIIRSGIAPGSVCITADSTGFTRGTFSEIMALNGAREAQNINREILADGGIKSPADCVKAFLAGSDYIMSGRLFVEANECRMHNDFERHYNKEKDLVFPKHSYFGMASSWGKIAMGNRVENIEGKSDFVIPTSSLQDIITTIWAGIKSGISYSGYSSVKNSIGNGVFESKI